MSTKIEYVQFKIVRKTFVFACSEWLLLTLDTVVVATNKTIEYRSHVNKIESECKWALSYRPTQARNVPMIISNAYWSAGADTGFF